VPHTNVGGVSPRRCQHTNVNGQSLRRSQHTNAGGQSRGQSQHAKVGAQGCYPGTLGLGSMPVISSRDVACQGRNSGLLTRVYQV
jgi:hypothetical protein